MGVGGGVLRHLIIYGRDQLSFKVCKPEDRGRLCAVEGDSCDFNGLIAGYGVVPGGDIVGRCACGLVQEMSVAVGNGC